MPRMTMSLDLEFEVEYAVQDGYRPTRTDPGCGDDAEIVSVRLEHGLGNQRKSVDVTDLLSDGDLEHIRERAIADYHESLAYGDNDF